MPWFDLRLTQTARVFILVCVPSRGADPGYRNKQMSNSSIPAFVADFLVLSNTLRVKRAEVSNCKRDLASLQPTISQWLLNIPNFEAPLEFDDTQRERFGGNGKLRFGIVKRRESLSRPVLSGYLQSFFTQLFPDKSEGEIDNIAKAASLHVWQSRKITRNRPVVLRTFSKKRKQSGYRGH